MDQAKKQQIKKYASWIGLAVLVALLAAMPLLAGSETATDGPQASILTGTVETGNIDTVLNGGGVLASPERTEINLPNGVKLREFLVANGDMVYEGTPLALVDRVSVMSAITSVQETMDYLVEQMNEAEDEDASDEIIALAGGRVKQIFAKEGERVQDVMLRDGALAVLSLDGLMAVRLENACSLSTGTGVDVLLSDGTSVDGRIESNLDGVVTITVEDDNYSVGEAVTVTDRDGNIIGSGELYVHNAWRAVAYTGVIEEVHAEYDESVDPEDLLFTLTDTDYTATRETLASQHREYEELMLRLFRMYQTETIDAPCAGVISGVDEDSIHLLSGSSQGFILDLLANAPNGDDGSFYLNITGIVTGTVSGNWNLSMDLTPLTIVNYQDLSGLTLDPTKMTQPVMVVPTAPVYELVEGQWVQIDSTAVLPGDYLLVAMDTNGSFVWFVRINEENRTPQIPEQTEPTVPATEPSVPEAPTVPVIPPVTEPPLVSPTDPSLPISPSEPTDPGAPSEPTVPSTNPSVPVIPSLPGGQYPGITLPDGYEDYFGNYGSYGNYGSFGDYAGIGGADTQEPEFELFDLDGSILMTVTEQETVSLTITLDEKCISNVSLGQQAQVRIEAIPDQIFPAVVTSIGTKGSNNGGSSKFTVELMLEKTDAMLPGMSASASIPLTTAENVPVVPLAALVEQGAQTLIYTGYDEESEVLINPVTVTIGVSDGEYAQVLSGLEPGDGFCYAYYDTLELSTDVDTQRSLFG